MFKCETHIVQLSTKKNNIFFTSDTHFQHANIIKYALRPYENAEEMTEDLIKRWNSVVKPNDIVFHLGDFMFGNINRFWEIRSRLNGKIYLIHGNHDYKLMCEGNIEQGFEDIAAQMNICIDGQKIYLSHFPFLTFDGIFKDKPSWQLFGHVHSNKEHPGTSPDIKRLDYLLPYQYDVGVDNNNYTPISFEQVKDIIEKQIAKAKIKA
jgi:calcineurin-like phosphoesterase family protein